VVFTLSTAMGTLFLQEVNATILVHDLRGFSSLVLQLGPVELSLALSRFYEHAAAAVEAHGGRVVKFMGDSVLSAFVGAGDFDHCGKAVQAIKTTLERQPTWLEENAAGNMPILNYSIAAAAGHILAGDLGTTKLRRFDVVGEPVNSALRLVGVATDRDASHLVTHDVIEGAKAKPTSIEVESVELGGKRVRLYRLEL
jgi:adenylate cyclase